MSSSRIPSPARSQGAKTTPRRYKPRASRSVGSPARSTTSVKLSAVIDMEAFTLSPMSARRSILSDTTHIDVPRRKSWWKKLDENSREIMEVLNNKQPVDVSNPIEEYFDVEVLSHDKKTNNFDLPESSDCESIKSIVIPQRKLFSHRESQPKRQFGQIINNRESLSELDKSQDIDEGPVSIGRKTLFNLNLKQRPKIFFPSALLNMTANQTIVNKTKELELKEPKGKVKTLFGAKAGEKRKNMFADFIASESEEEILDIQPKVFAFRKPEEKQQQIMTQHCPREPSPTSNMTDIEMDDWRHLPSSTMFDHQLEDGLKTTPNKTSKRAKLSKLSEALESINTESNTTANQSKQSNKTRLSKSKSKNVSKSEENESISHKENVTVVHQNQNISRGMNSVENTNNLLQNSNKQTSINKPNISGNASHIKATHESTDGKDSSVNEKQNTHKNNKTTTLSKTDQVLQSDDDEDVPLVYENDDEVAETNLENTSNSKNQGQNSEGQSVSNQLSILCNKQVIDPVFDDREFQMSKEIFALGHQNKSHNNSRNNTNTLRCNTNLEKQDSSGKNEEKAKEHLNNRRESYTEEVCDESKADDNNCQEHETDKEVIRENKDACMAEYDDDDEDLAQDNDQNVSQRVNEDLDMQNESNETRNITEESEADIEENNAAENEEKAVKSNATHDTSSKSAPKIETKVASPDVIRHEKTNEIESSTVRGRNTSVRKTKSMTKNLTIRPSLESSHLTEESGLSDKSKNSRESWDSHRTTRQTLRQTFGKDFTPRQSLRALVMEKSAKRRTGLATEISQLPLANSTRLPEAFSTLDTDIQGKLKGLDDGRESKESINNEIKKVSTKHQKVENSQIMEECDLEQELDDVDEVQQISKNNNDNSLEMDNIDDDAQIIYEDDNEQEAEENSEQEIEETDISQENAGDEMNEDDEVQEIDEDDGGDMEAAYNSQEVNNSDDEQEDDENDETQDTEDDNVRADSQYVDNSDVDREVAEDDVMHDSEEDDERSIYELDNSQEVDKSDDEQVVDGNDDSEDTHEENERVMREADSSQEQDITDNDNFVDNDDLQKTQEFYDEPEMEEANYSHEMDTEIDEAVGDNHEDRIVDGIDDGQDAYDIVHANEIASRKKRRTSIEMYLQNVKNKNIELRKQRLDQMREKLRAPIRDVFNAFKLPAVPKHRMKPMQTNTKVKPLRPAAAAVSLPPEILEDMKYKPPKRYKPANASWITKHLYKFLETKLEPKYDYSARVRSEKLVETIYQFTKDVRRHGTAPAHAVEALKLEMARLRVVRTHFEFYEFFHEFMPREVRIKVVPDAFNNISMPRNGIFSDIISSN